jgi:hypothetical protein
LSAGADDYLAAMTDALTELPNRRALHEMVATETARIARGGPDSCLAMIDLDNFKQANDAYGHRIGDEVLTHIARTLRVAARRIRSVAWAATSSSSSCTAARPPRQSIPASGSAPTSCAIRPWLGLMRARSR